MAKVLSPNDFGIVALAQTFPVIAVSVFTTGLVGSAQRFFFEYRKDRKKLNSLYFSVQLYLYLMFLASTLFVYMTKGQISDLIARRPDYGLAVLTAYIAAYIGSINVFYFGAKSTSKRFREWARQVPFLRKLRWKVSGGEMSFSSLLRPTSPYHKDVMPIYRAVTTPPDELKENVGILSLIATLGLIILAAILA